MKAPSPRLARIGSPMALLAHQVPRTCATHAEPLRNVIAEFTAGRVTGCVVKFDCGCTVLVGLVPEVRAS
jgi:hypothetical protein